MTDNSNPSLTPLGLDAINMLREIFVLIDPDLKYISWNRAMKEVTGYSDEEIKGLTPYDLHPHEDYQSVKGVIDTIFKSGEPRRVETSIITRDGRRIPYELSGALVSDESGKPLAIAGLGIDITDRKRAEDALRNMVKETNERREEITALLESTRLVLERKDFLGVCREILRLCKNLVAAPAGYVALFEGEGSNVVLVEPESLRAEVPEEGTMPVAALHGTDFELGKTVILNEVDGTPLAERLPKGHFAVRNLMLSPLIVDSTPVGLIVLANKAPGFNRRDSMMASAFGEIASLALQNATSLEMLKDSEERYRQIFKLATEGIFQSTVEGTHINVNPSFAQMFGFSSPEQLMSEVSSIADQLYSSASDREAVLRLLDDPGYIKGMELQGKRRNGELMWFALNAHTVRDEQGRILFYEGTTEDITEKKKTEDALKFSEQKYRLLVDTAPDIIYSIDASGTLTDVNEAFEAVTGFSREEWLGKPFAPLIHPDDLQLAIETFELARQGGSPEPYELRILTRDGGYLTGEFISKPLVKEGEPAGEFGVARDITARKEAERALVESEQHYRALLATSPDSVLVLDLDFVIQMVSDRAVEHQRASSAEEIIGLNAIETLNPDQRDTVIEMAAELLKTGVSRPLDLTVTRRDGTTFDGEMIASVLRDAEGNPKAYIATMRDVTERKQVERELQILNNELEGYAHAVSHDLKGPLASISAASETIQSLLTGDLVEDDITGIREMAAIVSNNVDKSTALIEGLLELAEAGQRPYDATEVDVAEVVDGIIAERRDAIKERRVKVHTPRHLGRVIASPTHMYQLFGNLIDNAIKHNTSKKPTIEVAYEGRDASGAHRYVVRDNGPGIDPGEAENIFLPFVSGAGGRSGLGLATVEKIVGVYGGTIEVANDDGARFEFGLYDAV